jgi:hypothetical protein
MFTTFLQSHPMEEMLREGSRSLYPAAGDRQAWDGVPEEMRMEIRKLAAAWRDIPYPMRSASGFLAFVRNGSRQADEKPYFTRRKKLCAAVLNACVFPEETEADAIVDGIWCICEESSWVISAHNVNPVPGAPKPAEYPLPDPKKPYIDLFSAQTGMILSLASTLLEERLDSVTPMIRQRIRSEIRGRILRPFMATDDFWWMGVRRKDLNNWTPWILSNIMVCAVLDPMPRVNLAGILERCCEMLDRYLDVLPEDGGCDEGAGYWNMAGGALLDCLEILEKVTGGGMAFWTDEKIRNILAFPRKAALANGWFVNFADCDARPFLSGERLERAGERLGDSALTALGTQIRGHVADQLDDVPHLTRVLDLLFHPAAETAKAAVSGDEWLPDLQVRVVRRGEWILACKGGHNGENHNHNDVGSFILLQGGEPAVVDAGNMIYTAKTFSEERYTLWNVQAQWHNLPMIGGAAQREGAEHRSEKAERTPDGMALNLEKAYGAEAGVKRLRRSFSLSGEGLRLRDEVELEEEKPVTWVFLLREKPAWKNGRVTAGRMQIRCPEGLDFSAEEKPVTDPRMARNWPGSLWRVRLQGKPAKDFSAEFAFAAKDQEA